MPDPDSLLIEIPLADVREAVRAAVRSSFDGPSVHSREGGPGYAAVRRQAQDRIAIQLPDAARPLIDAEIASQLPGVIRGVLEEELAALVKKSWRQLRSIGRVEEEAQLLLRAAGKDADRG